ncbi:uncharacterized protein B0P05DRAFT_573955 [Gilbertella persicaria]|uniref:uncharacterized protein n=1 Tax=Gilbertella persicaria TaxID=101096 RepID=UPI00222127F2|nr:uncharacterized protein B0P05DRAFT_573955 [Gilbertella persicaria]KAI8066297.1 hypothetical protein B0P05DRAFT_573955 [Gilbertella persicaria]
MSSFKPTIPNKPETFSLVVPGLSPAAASLSEQLLVQNNERFHIFFNDKKFHNHLIHHLLAAYSFGATKERIQEIFDFHAKDQRPLPPSIGEITRDNYKQHLGDAAAYTSFLNFFKLEIDRFGMLETVRRFVWSNDFLARTVGGLYHPLIHIGYGLEFDIPGIVAEGLSMAALTEPYFTPVIPHQPELNRSNLLPSQAQSLAENAHTVARGYVSQAFDQITSQLATRLGIADEKTTSTAHQDRSVDVDDNHGPDYMKNNSLFAIFNHIQKDPVFDNLVKSTDDNKFKIILANEKAVERVKHYVKQWGLNENTKNIQAKFKELYSVAAILTGAAGVRKDYPGVLRLSFFLVHVLTSTEFVHQFISRVAPSEAVALLQAHLAETIIYYVAEGRPEFYLEGLIDYKPSVHTDSSQNQWLPVLDKALERKEAHVIKAVRSCAVAQVMYGPHGDPNLDLIWLRVAQMAVDVDGNWDFDGVGFDDTWKQKA